MEFPTEVQIMILERIELVAPGKLTWHTLWGFNGDREQDEVLRCRTCQVIVDRDWDFHGRYPGTVLRWCEGWKFPISLFPVNSSMRQLATEVFYSKNYFEVMPVLRDGDDPCYDGSFLLSRLQANALRYDSTSLHYF